MKDIRVPLGWKRDYAASSERWLSDVSIVTYGKIHT